MFVGRESSKEKVRLISSFTTYLPPGIRESEDTSGGVVVNKVDCVQDRDVPTVFGAKEGDLRKQRGTPQH